MSVFKGLLERAKASGKEVTTVCFEVDLPRFLSDPEAESWLAFSEPWVNGARGRSGEEALRRLVDELEKR